MGMDFISAGWTTDSNYKTDEESVNRWIDDLSDFAVLTRLDQLDESGAFEWEVHLTEPDEHGAEFPIDEHHEDDGAYEENKRTAQEIRDTLKVGAAVAFDSDGRLSNAWPIPGTSLVFNLMGGGSWGDDPFDGYTPLVMFIDALEIWPDLKELTGVVCGGIPDALTIYNHIDTSHNDTGDYDPHGGEKHRYYEEN